MGQVEGAALFLAQRAIGRASKFKGERAIARASKFKGGTRMQRILRILRIAPGALSLPLQEQKKWLLGRARRVFGTWNDPPHSLHPRPHFELGCQPDGSLRSERSLSLDARPMDRCATEI
jgi:hypothetical protein